MATAAQISALKATVQGISNTISNNAAAINNATPAQKASLSSGLSAASAGLTAYAKSGGGGGSSSTPAPTAPITTASIAPTTPITLPTPVVTQAPSIGAMNAGITGSDKGISNTPNGALTVDPIVQTSLDAGKSNFDSYVASLNKANTDRTTGADVQAQVVKASHQQQYQKSVNDYTSQINTIVANRDAQNLGLEGTGRGQTTGFIGGEQARITKEAAIQALPIQALLANAQGNLDTANQYINTWGKILMDDANNAYNHKVATYQAVYDFANTQEKTKLDSLQAQQKIVRDQAIALTTAKTEAIKQALSQPGGSSVVQAITAAPDLAGVATATGKYNGDVLGNAVKQAQLRKLNEGPTPSAPAIQKINGVDMQWDAKTKTWVNPSTGSVAPTNVQHLATIKSNIDTVNSVLTSPALSSTVGTNVFSSGTPTVGSTFTRALTGAGIGATVGGTGGAFLGGVGAIPGAIGGAIIGGIGGALTNAPAAYQESTGERQNFLAAANQISEQLTLTNLQNAKANGATFGALSEGELNLLKASASKLNQWAVREGDKPDGKVIGYNTSEANFKKELDKINSFAKLDYILKGGLQEDVGVFKTPDNIYHTKDSKGNVISIN